MTIGIASASARPLRWSLVTAVAAALTLAVVPAVQVQAQAPAANKPKPDPKPAPPKQPAAQPQQPPAPAPQPAVAQNPNLVYSPWTKVCAASPAGNGAPVRKVCFTSTDALTERGIPVVAAALIELEGEPTKLFRITLPFNVSLREGMRLIIDQNAPMPMPYTACMPINPNMGCVAQFEGTPDLINQLKKGQTLTIQAVNLQNQIASVPFALADFAKAAEGAPTDQQVYEQQQKKMHDDLQKKLEQQQGAPAVPKP